ncbi:DUF1569 domain-containing protein [Psychroserpens jangbogonensis]|uniref:DUF1569 domain-containing protein n=1 Tax=Psychroserpens jangbogonensis TaxID=1484460 RepID=UPI00053E49B6|nr:DUF1569 domain-containing protein [Psychroserpens jangbogonensis]
MKSIFTPEAHTEIMSRIKKLDEHTQPQWGKMSVGQMLNHCQFPLHIILEKEDYNLKPNWLVNLLFKKTMYSDKPWRKNLPTVPRFKATDKRRFSEETPKLISLLEELHTHKDRTDWQPHPAFGELTKEQWGKMQYKHLDHHLKQFGA